MVMGIDEFVLRRFDDPDEVRQFPLGRFELVRVSGMTLGRATYEPGWKWSQHVGSSPEDRCQVEHLGVVISGRAAVVGDTYDEVMESGDVFAVPPGHDSWVVGDRPYVSLHLLGSEEYATGKG
jgi:mannose-6-phosphate isomerase-like protein (cupin superfamily)